MRKSGSLAIAISGVIASAAALAAPSVSGVSGNVTHESTVTFSGNGFGSKAQAAPAVWDDCSQAGLSSQWSGAWPNASGNSNLECRAPIRNVTPPHNRSSMYLAGGHVQSAGSNGGYNVLLYKTRNISSYPAYTYASWYQRADDSWTFCGDNNFKTYAFGEGTSPYEGSYWYHEYNPTIGSRTQTDAQWHYNYLESPDRNGHNYWWDTAANPHAGKWVKIEQEIQWARDGTGYFKLWENGKLKVNYAGRTDLGGTGGQRTEAIGGYARCYGYATNWRYFADVYLDYSRARVVLANNVNLSQATVIEPQPATSWSNTSISVRLNLGALAADKPIYAFVFDQDGTHNSAGFPVANGGPVPNPPTEVRAN